MKHCSSSEMTVCVNSKGTVLFLDSPRIFPINGMKQSCFLYSLNRGGIYLYASIVHTLLVRRGEPCHSALTRSRSYLCPNYVCNSCFTCLLCQISSQLKYLHLLLLLPPLVSDREEMSVASCMISRWWTVSKSSSKTWSRQRARFVASSAMKLIFSSSSSILTI